MWNFHDFLISQILREINFGGSRSAKSAIITYLQALNFDFHGFLHFLKAEIYQINQIQSQKVAKTTLLQPLNFPKLISRKI